MAEKQDMSHKYNEGENLELDNPVYYLESSHPAPPYTEAPPYPNASNSGAPYTGAPYTGAPYKNAPYTFTPQAEAPHAGAPFSQYTSTAVLVQQPRQTTTVIVRETQSYMGLAVFACLCCFWPLGLVAISRANESQNSLARGDLEGAAARGREARNYSLWSIVVAIMGATIYIIIHFAVLH
uniref:Proline-rich transmembrane protein 1 n=1 Tax=Arion vulgaris TaxID=1028688 RepID=A0A0B7B831_9EUPU